MQHLPCWISRAKRNPIGGVVVSMFRSKSGKTGSGGLLGRLSSLALVFFLTIPVLVFGSINAHAAQVTLGWDQATGVAGYKLYYGTASGNYAYYVDVGDVTTYGFTDLSAGSTYYFAVADYDSSGNQSGYSNEVSYTVPSACTYSISPTSASVSASGVTGGSITVTTQSGCAWTASSAASWVTITSGASGTGSGTVTYSVAANTATSSRTAASTIAGSSFTVTQAAAAAQSSTYTITASAGSGGSISPSGTVTVSSGASKKFTFTAKSGYTVSNVTVDGTSKGALSSYTFSNVKANHTISVTFKSRWVWWR